MQMVNHGVSTGALFLMVGMIYERRHTRQISELKGLQHVAPIFAAAFTVVMLSSIGVPGLNGFVGEYLILIGAFLTARWWLSLPQPASFSLRSTCCGHINVCSTVSPMKRTQHSPNSAKEALVILPFIAVIFFTGVYPKPMLERIEPAVNALIGHVEERTDFVEPQPAAPIVDDEVHSHGEED